MRRVILLGLVTGLVTGLLLGSARAARAEDYTPDLDRIRAGLQRGVSHPVPELQETALRVTGPRQIVPDKRRDSIWNGLLIGAAVGAILDAFSR